MVLELALIAHLAGATPAEARYDVRYDLGDPHIVRVEAELPSSGRRLTVGARRPHPKDHHFGDYVDDVTMRTPDGTPVAFERDGRDAWRLVGPATERVRVTYTLRVEHGSVGWSPSHAEVAYSREDGVFARGWTLLLVGDDVDRARVRFELAGGARVFCSLDPDPDEPGLHVGTSAEDVLQCGVFLGAPQHARFAVGGVDVQLVVTHDLPGAHDVMRAPLEEALEAATDYFGSAATGRYVVFASRRPGPVSSGSGFRNGMSMLFPDDPENDLGGDWLHTLVHELVHTWNGVALERVGTGEEWFNEGFTNYVTLHLTGVHGLSSPAWRRTYLAKKWNAYLARAGETSLTDAGRDKGRHSDLLYGGGMVAALALDLWIREDSGGERTLANLFRELLADHGPAGRPFATADVQRVAEGLVERDLGPFFERHVHGTEPITPEPFLAALGLALETVEAEDGPRAELRLDPDADAAARARAAELLGIE